MSPNKDASSRETNDDAVFDSFQPKRLEEDDDIDDDDYIYIEGLNDDLNNWKNSNHSAPEFDDDDEFDDDVSLNDLGDGFPRQSFHSCPELNMDNSTTDWSEQLAQSFSDLNLDLEEQSSSRRHGAQSLTFDGNGSSNTLSWDIPGSNLVLQRKIEYDKGRCRRSVSFDSLKALPSATPIKNRGGRARRTHRSIALSSSFSDLQEFKRLSMARHVQKVLTPAAERRTTLTRAASSRTFGNANAAWIDNGPEIIEPVSPLPPLLSRQSSSSGDSITQDLDQHISKNIAWLAKNSVLGNNNNTDGIDPKSPQPLQRPSFVRAMSFKKTMSGRNLLKRPKSLVVDLKI